MHEQRDPQRMLTMHILGTFATGQQRGMLILWTTDPLGNYATTHPKEHQCSGP